MKPQRPITYVQWRDVFQREMFHFGTSATVQEFYRLNKMERMREWHARTYWRRYFRILRIQKRLGAEHEAMDDSYLKEIARWAFEGET